mmetsp:Transcript_52205/g.113748  ORF Transcript_52205/g.113748 Transcript_52205/m.113748 type:complete len:218 (+) Transcript_52205:124-777(+)
MELPRAAFVYLKSSPGLRPCSSSSAAEYACKVFVASFSSWSPRRRAPSFLPHQRNPPGADACRSETSTACSICSTSCLRETIVLAVCEWNSGRSTSSMPSMCRTRSSSSRCACWQNVAVAVVCSNRSHARLHRSNVASKFRSLAWCSWPLAVETPCTSATFPHVCIDAAVPGSPRCDPERPDPGRLRWLRALGGRTEGGLSPRMDSDSPLLRMAASS